MEEIRAGSIAARVEARPRPRALAVRPLLLPIAVLLLLALLAAAGVFWLGGDPARPEPAVPSAGAQPGAAAALDAGQAPEDPSAQAELDSSLEPALLSSSPSTLAAEGVEEDPAADAATSAPRPRRPVGDERLIALANERAKKEAARIAQALEMGATDEASLAGILREESERLREGMASLGRSSKTAAEVRDEVAAWKRSELELAFGTSLAEQVLAQGKRVPNQGAELQRPGSGSALRRGGRGDDGRGGR
jgi:hypothetical protein